MDLLSTMQFDRVITEHDNANLVALLSVEGIDVVKSFRWKAPRSNGFPAEFDQATRLVIQDDLVHAIHRFFQSKFILPQLNHTLLLPNPKET